MNGILVLGSATRCSATTASGFRSFAGSGRCTRRCPPICSTAAPRAVSACHLEGRSHILVVDAVDFGGRPGDLVRLPASQVPARIGLKLSEHQVRFREVLALMDLLRITPRDFLVLGVQPRSSRWGETLSPEVEAAIPEAVQQIGKQVAAWANSGERHPLSPGDRLLGSRL